MGSGQSARKLTIDNEEIGVIGISESVVERLTQKMNESYTDVTNKVRSSSLTESSPKKIMSPQLPQSGDISTNSGYHMEYPGLTLSALIIQQQKEQELRNQDDYWQKRLQNLEQQHSKIDEIIDAEYKKAVEQLYSSDKKNVNIQESVQPCQDNSEIILKCYQDHPKEILKCSVLVEEFSNCVDQHRARVISARC